MRLTAEAIQGMIRDAAGTALREHAEIGGGGTAGPDWRQRFMGGTGYGPTNMLGAPVGMLRQRRALDPIRNDGSEGRPDDRGMRMAGIVLAMATARGNVDQAARLIEQRYPDAESEIMLRALAAGSAVDGGFLVIGDTADEVIELLRPASVFRRMRPTTLPMANGVLTIRKLVSGAAAAYTGENEDIAVTQPEFGQLRLTARKLAAIVPISNDLIRAPSAGAESVVRDDLVAAMATRSDLAFLRGTGLADTPKGLRYWAPAANVIPANGTVNLANVTADLSLLLDTLESADVRMIRPGWLMAPRTKNYLMQLRDGNGNFAYRDEMLRGTLWGFPFAVTTQIPTNLGVGGDESEIYFVDFADAILAEVEGLMLDTSEEASYVENGTLVSAYSRDQTLIRAIQLHDVGMRHDASVAVLTEVTWGA